MNDESIIDTLLDCMGYSLIGIAMQEKQWGGPGPGGAVHNESYRAHWIDAMARLFAKKLRAYGTNDLKSLDQVTQRMHEKLYRIDNLLKGMGNEDHKFRIRKHAEDVIGILPPQKAGDAGFDLVANEDFTVYGFDTVPSSIPCGFSAKIPAGHWAEIRPRSSTATKLGILVHQSVMDEGYTGPWFVVCHSLNGVGVTVPRGTRLAQCILHKVVMPPLEFVTELPQTERGETGFGSSGLKV